MWRRLGTGLLTSRLVAVTDWLIDHDPVGRAPDRPGLPNARSLAAQHGWPAPGQDCPGVSPDIGGPAGAAPARIAGAVARAPPFGHRPRPHV